MAGSRVVAILGLAVLLPFGAAASAQPAPFTGTLTGHIGAASGGAVRDAAGAAGASLAVLDTHGLGPELDFGHAGGFDSARFADSGVTSLMLGVMVMYPHPDIRPFVTLGAGVLRVRADDVADRQAISRTDAAFAAGAGVLYMLSEVLGVRGDVRYFRFFDRHLDVPVGNGGVFDYWRTSLGVTYSWPIR